MTLTTGWGLVTLGWFIGLSVSIYMHVGIEYAVGSLVIALLIPEP